MKNLTLLISALFCAVFSFSQVTVNIIPDKDNSIFSESGLESAALNHLYVGQTCQANNRRALIHFDVAGNVPAGVTITNVTLDMNNDKKGSGTTTETIFLHPLLADFGEGTSFSAGPGGQGATAVAPDATWTDSQLGTPWTTPGGDFGPAVAQTDVTALGTYSWSSAGMIANVQTWLDTPSSNYGWMIIGDESTTCQARRFGSKDQGVAPVLNITYTCAGTVTASCQSQIVYLDISGNGTLNPADLDNGSTSSCPGSLSFSASQTTFDCVDVTGFPVSDLVISAAYDGPLTGGTPKGVELYAVNNISDLSIYGLGSANNGGGTDGQEFTFPAVSVTAGTYIYVSNEAVEFQNFFGFAPDYTHSSMLINGDDAVELFMNNNVVDVFGDINVDGTGEPWEYLDGWAYRMNNTGPDGSTFVLGNWTFSGPNALDGETSNGTATNPVPIGTFTTTGGGGATPISVSMTATDQFSNSDNCSADVYVVDTVAPTVNCIGTGTFFLDGTGNLTLTVGDFDTGSSDACGIQSSSINQTNFDCTDLGTNLITLTVIDVNGNSGTCVSTIDIQQSGGLSAVLDSVTNLSCFGDTDGAAYVTTTGGTPPYQYDWDNDGTGDFDDSEDLTGLAAGTYNLQVLDAAGCISNVIATITDPGEVIPTFNVTDISCVGLSDGEIDMTITGGTAPYTHDWDNDGTGDFDDPEDLTGLAVNTYNVSIIDANGCTGSGSATVADAIPVDVTVTVSGVTMTSNEAGATYQWINCPGLDPISGATDSSYTATVNGDYAVIVTNGNGCTDTSACVTIDQVTIDESNLATTQIYPNPTDGAFTVQLNANHVDQIQIIDLNGRILVNRIPNQSTEFFDLRHFESGIYFVKILADEQMLTKKVIIQAY